MNDNKLSRSIIKELRHNKGISRNDNGYTNISVIVSMFNLKDNFQLKLRNIVNSDNKSRFGVLCKNGKELCENLTEEDIITHIRANQGHSCDVKINMEKITDPNTTMIHGTDYKAWNIIQTKGLSKMKRDYIHFAEGLPGKVKSGMRPNSKVLIYIDVGKVLNDGIQIYKSSNGVILCTGVDGILEPKYFKNVVFL